MHRQAAFSDGYKYSGTDAYVCSKDTGGFYCHDADWALDADTAHDIDYGFMVRFFGVYKVEYDRV